MKISFETNIDNYINFLITRSKKLPEGKNRRKRFYVGFSLLYFLLSIVTLVVLIFQQIIIDPYAIMLFIIYVVVFTYMLVVDAYSMVIARRFRKDAQDLNLDNKYTLEQDKGMFVLKFDGKQEKYNISDQTMYHMGEEYVTLFFDQNTGVSIPVEKYNNEFIDFKKI